MKKNLFILVIILFLFPCTLGMSASSSQLIVPSLDEIKTEEQVAIIVYSDDADLQVEKEKLKAQGVAIRYIFNYALKGFSVEATNDKLAQIERNQTIHHLTTVKNYTVQAENDNIQLIGGEAIRGYFDDDNHRLTGEGVKVGVIDTGIDYRHPDLRISYGGGKDLVDQDDDPMETVNMGRLDTLHGTHVAGIIAANGKVKGVAPKAEVIAYRALGPGGSGTTEQVLQAIEQAMKDKVDVINLSLGNNVNGPDLPISLALNKAVDSGIVAVTSSGNSGPGIWSVGSPGTAAKAISVGASTPTLKVPYLHIGKKEMKLYPMQGTIPWDLNKSFELYNGGIGKEEQLKGANGKVVIVERGELTFTEKSKNAKEAGALALLIYNNTPGSFMGNLEELLDIPVVSLTKEDGEEINQELSQAKRLYGQTVIKEEKDILAEFSSRGPVTSTWEIKPDVVAPGVAINSTVPGGYTPLQGTSMAAPHVAGAAALLIQAHPEWRPEQVKAALMNTALSMVNEDGTPYRTFEQGAGRIQLKEALMTSTLIYPSSIQFGKFKLSEQHHDHVAKITVENTTDEKQSYAFEIPKKQKGIEWRLPLSFMLEPNEKKTISLHMIVNPKELTEKLADGTIRLNSNKQTIQLPYLYVLEEPDYPRVMGFSFGKGDSKKTYRYEVYLPGGAEEFGIALFDSTSLTFIGMLDWKKDVKKGQVEEDLVISDLPQPGLYIAKVFARKSGQEDWIETRLFIGANGELEMIGN
ncbi:S8 family serine peptidase [Cytobacillus kochii]|uniref:S8 family serine peptidase n=1 Tax=Cytobacillus kochii TaxID=859143 RepID=UPI002E240F97|nr:S8 family serine peptidase [Cytobacillus kochii]MED1605811.1 S8 family serine peptidase [Cytobacillus kochii]